MCVCVCVCVCVHECGACLYVFDECVLASFHFGMYVRCKLSKVWNLCIDLRGIFNQSVLSILQTVLNYIFTFVCIHLTFMQSKHNCILYP